MPTDYVMPKLAMAMNEGTINEWLVASGEKVSKGQLLATVETEKVAYDLESPLDGYLHITVPAGETVPVEQQIAIFVDSEDELAGLSAGSADAVSPEPTTDSTAGEPAAEASTASPHVGSASVPDVRIKASPLNRITWARSYVFQ